MASSLPNGPGHPSPTQSIPAHPSPSCLQACAGPAPTPETPSCSPSTALRPGPAQVCPLRPDSPAGPGVRAPQASQALSQESQASPKQRDVQIETWFLALSRAFENRKGFRATGRRASENALPVPAGSRQAAASQTPLPALPGDPSCALAGPPPRCPRRPQRGGGRLPPPAPGGHGPNPHGPGRAPGHGASPTSVSAPDAALRLGVALSPTALHVPGVPRCPGVAHPALACHLPQHVTSSEPRRRVLGDRTALRSRPHRRRSALCHPSLHAAAEGHRAPGTCARGRRRPPGRPAGEAPPRRPRRACAVQSAPRPRAAPEVPASPRVPGRVLRHVPRGRRRAAAARVRSRFRLRGMSGARSECLLTNLCCGMICNRQTSQASLFSMLVI